jgi:hypothetical protein
MPTGINMELSREELKELIAEAVKEHTCVLNSDTVKLLNNEENMEVFRTIGKGLTPKSANTLATLGRMLDQVAFSLGTLLLRIILVGGAGVIIYIFFKNTGITISHP